MVLKKTWKFFVYEQVLIFAEKPAINRLKNLFFCQ